MLPRWLPTSFGSIRLIVREQITIDYFQDGNSGSHLGYYSEIILAILNFYVASMPPTKFWFILTYYLEADVVWSFSRWPSWLTIEDSLDGCHYCRLGYREKKMILRILNFFVVPMPPTKLRLNPTYHPGANEVWRFSRWPLWLQSWILEQSGFSYSESLCRSDASHKVWSEYSLSAWRNF